METKQVLSFILNKSPLQQISNQIPYKLNQNKISIFLVKFYLREIQALVKITMENTKD